MGEDTDEALAARAARGDETAFARLVERHYGLIFRVAWRWCGAPADAEDAAQEVCIKLARAIASFRGDAAFTTWLTRMTINTVRDMMRAGARRSRTLGALALVEAQACQGPDHGAAGDVWRAVAALPARQRDAVLLVHGEGMSHGEAARVLGCRESTVSWHLHAARKALKSRLKD